MTPGRVADVQARPESIVTTRGNETGGEEWRRVQHLSIETNTYWGLDACLTLPARLAAYGFKRPSLVIDGAVAALPSTATLLEAWQREGLRLVQSYAVRVAHEPDYEYLDVVTEEFRATETDVVIGVGGGSAMDLAKGIGLLLRNPGRGLRYRGMDRVVHPGVAVVLLPTTAGSGSEVTASASFIDPQTKTKLGINGRHVGAFLVILDPALLVSAPASVTIGSGLDALVHAMEAVTTKTAHAVSRLFGVEAVRLLFAALPRAVAEPVNLDARAMTLLGSHYAGIAMRNAGGGPASGISYPLGVHYQVPHGFAGGILLPHVVSFNVAHGYTAGYAQLYGRLDGASAATSDDATKAAAFRDAFWQMYRAIGTPVGLGQWGVDRGAVASLADLTMQQRQGNLDANPVPFGRDDVCALLEAVTR